MLSPPIRPEPPPSPPPASPAAGPTPADAGSGDADALRRIAAEAEARRVVQAGEETMQLAGSLIGLVTQAQRNGSSLSQSVRSARDRVMVMAASIDELGATSRTIAEQVQTSHRSMAQASGRIDQASQDLTLLRDSVAEIGSVVGMIAGVARQTNLLALNATIEAARAGEAGRGFAVVAQEVKALSFQTQEATQRVASIIERLRGHALDGIEGVATVEAMIRSLEESFAAVSEALVIQVSSTAEIAEGTSEAVRCVDEAGRSGAELSRLQDEMNRRVAELRLAGRHLAPVRYAALPPTLD